MSREEVMIWCGYYGLAWPRSVDDVDRFLDEADTRLAGVDALPVNALDVLPVVGNERADLHTVAVASRAETRSRLPETSL